MMGQALRSFYRSLCPECFAAHSQKTRTPPPHRQRRGAGEPATMEQADRETLQRNNDALINDMDFESVASGLLARGIFEDHDKEGFDSQPSQRDKNMVLLMELETMGPMAFTSLVASLVESNQVHLAELLGYVPSSGSSQGQTGNAQATTAHEHKPAPFDQPSQQVQTDWPPRESTGDFSSTRMDVLTSYSQAMVDSDKVYKMKSRPRGVAVIINNKNFKTLKKRAGTDIDCRNLENVFRQLGFNVVVHKDLKRKDIQQLIEQLRNHNHTQFDCFIFAVLSHGIEGAVYGVDEDLVKIEDIVSQFGSDRCPTLNGKPKLFFLQACRGEKFDEGVEATDGEAVRESGDASDAVASAQVDAQMDDDQLAKLMIEMELESTDSFASSRSKVPSQSDMLLAYATVPGFVSWRNSERGSWFIQALTETILQYGKEEDLLSMITMVNSKVARAFESSSAGRHKQMPAPVTMLTKKLFFCPGHYE